MVMINNNLQRLSKVIADRRATHPKSAICYHDIPEEVAEDAPTSFKVMQTARVHAVVAPTSGTPGENGKVTLAQFALAGALPMNFWEKKMM
eukprot:11925832-Alexandrium_andersonii.AAC.1